MKGMNISEKRTPVSENSSENFSALPALSDLLSAGRLRILSDSGAVSWRVWLERTGGLWGFVLLMCGVACFLAANWAGMSNAARLGLMQGGLVFFVLMGMLSQRRKKILSGVCLLGAGLMVGAFLIVFSQIYQTGADSWQLFAFWAVGVLPWLLLSPSLPLWLLMLVLTNMALALWGAQDVANWHSRWSQRSILWCLQWDSALWLGCVGVECVAWRRRSALQLRTARRWGLAVLPFLLSWATLGGCLWLLDRIFGDYSPDLRISMVGVFALGILVVVALYERITRRVGPFCLLALCGFPLLNCALGLMVEAGDAGLMLFLYGSANLGYTALVLHTLAALRHVPPFELPVVPSIEPPDVLPVESPAAEEQAASAAPSASLALVTDLPSLPYAPDLPGTPQDTPGTPGTEVQGAPDPHTVWKHRQKSHSRKATRQVGQVFTHVLAGLGALLSSLFLVIFVVYTFGDFGSSVGFSLIMAVAFLGAGLGCVRLSVPSSEGAQSSFFRTLALSLSLGGWFFLVAGVWVYWESPMVGLVLLPAAALLYIIQPQPVWRFLSVGSVLTVFIVSLTGERLASEMQSLVALCVLIVCAVPLYLLAAWGKWRPAGLTPEKEQALLPCLYAGIGVLFLFLPLWGWLIPWLPALSYWWTNWSLVLLAIPVVGLIVLLISQSVWHYRLHREKSAYALGHVAIVVVGLAVLYFLIHHIARSFLLVLLLPLLGHACRLRLMARVGQTLLGVFLFFHYYSWGVTFLVKAQSMTLVGFVLLTVAMVAALWRRKNRQKCARQNLLRQQTPESHAALQSSQGWQTVSPASARRFWAWRGAALVALGLTLGSFQYALHDREKILAQGDTVLFSLAPVDPLSYVQGYYMALAYTLDRDLAQQLFAADANGTDGTNGTEGTNGTDGTEGTNGTNGTDGTDESSTPLAPKGFAVLERTPDDPLPIAQLKTVRSALTHDSVASMPGEYVVPYRLNSFGRPSLALPRGFLMEESMAQAYAQARYGVFRCVPGVCILTGLADSSGQIIEKPGPLPE